MKATWSSFGISSGKQLTMGLKVVLVPKRKDEPKKASEQLERDREGEGRGGGSLGTRLIASAQKRLAPRGDVTVITTRVSIHF